MTKRKISLILALFFSLVCFRAFGAPKAYIHVTSNVTNGLVYLDGKLQGVTPITLEVTPSVNHTVRVSKAGYIDKDDTGWVAAGYTGNWYIALEPKPTTGTIVVKANVYGASVYLDGSYKGTTPYTINNVSPGSHTIRVSKTNYDDLYQKVYIIAGETETWEFKFIGATLRVDANVYGADVYVDSIYKGTTPLTLSDLEPGYRTIKVTKKHYSTAEKSMSLKANTTNTLTATIEKISGYLNVTTTPSYASVYCDGSAISKVSEEIDEGVHTIKARAFGYYDKSESVRITRNQTTNHSMTLEKAPFKITGFTRDNESFNPKNSKRLNKVTFTISVTAPETGRLSITDAGGNEMASWEGSFTTWDTDVEWDGMHSGSPVNEGVYTATITAGGYSQSCTVTVDHTIKNYAQRARSSGIFFDVGNLKGPFYDGFDLGMSTFIGGKHFYGGLAFDFLFADITDDAKDYADARDLVFWDIEFLLGLSFNWHRLRPYTHGGIGYYYCLAESKTRDEHDVSGLVLSWTTGMDIVFDHFYFGGYYKLRKFNGAGYTDSFGLSFGWAFDSYK
ncbi:MAG: PEGA domain-containing protein [Treponema sp.]|nr:PEGA domain-containing protein [Treponema sp.]